MAARALLLLAVLNLLLLFSELGFNILGTVLYE
jgi:hypothetical protein